MYHKIENNKYLLFSDNNEVLLTIELTDEKENQIIMSTSEQVYNGPIKFLDIN